MTTEPRAHRSATAGHTADTPGPDPQSIEAIRHLSAAFLWRVTGGLHRTGQRIIMTGPEVASHRVDTRPTDQIAAGLPSTRGRTTRTSETRSSMTPTPPTPLATPQTTRHVAKKNTATREAAS